MTGKIVAQVKYTRTKKTGEGTPATAVGKLEKKKTSRTDSANPRKLNAALEAGKAT